MPIANTWTEELVAEWLHLEGFLVEVGLPASVTGKGGRREADVVGARINDGKLDICHCEVAEWAISGKVTEIVANYSAKFSKDVCNAVESYFCNIFGTGQIYRYRKLVITKYFSNKRFPKMLEQSIPDSEVILLDDFIKNLLVESVKNWTERHRTPKGNPPQLPRTLWLLKMIEFLVGWKINFESETSWPDK